MKSTQDWSFITSENQMPKPALNENKVFHALTSAYAKNKELEVYSATENIMRREKELCQMAIRDLQGLVSNGEGEETLKMILDHYQTRFQSASEKEAKLKHLSEDSKKLNEEHRRKNQELAEVKRNLMDSQAKLRELTKVADKLSKKEEELRFIESHLKGELEKNRLEMLNGLYEIVAEYSDGEDAHPLGSKSAFLNNTQEEYPGAVPEAEPPPVIESRPLAEPRLPSPTGTLNSNKGATLFGDESVPDGNTRWAPRPPEVNSSPLDPRRLALITDRYLRLKGLEPSKTICSKSLVKAPDGKVLCEYFFGAKTDRDSRHYVFNTVFSMHFLLECLTIGAVEFHRRIELSLGDLSSRLNHGQTIHLEAGCQDIFSREALSRILALKEGEKAKAYVELAEKCIQRLESLGPKRIELIENQIEALKVG